MVIVFFFAHDQRGKPRKCSLGGESLEANLDALTQMIEEGWTLQAVELLVVDNLIRLPVEIFDGQLFSEPIQRLRYEWESLLYK